MAANPFAQWTPEMVANHNARFGGKQHPPSEIIEANTHALKMSLPKLTSKPLLNKLESDFKAELEYRGHRRILSQSITLKIGTDCRYTADFATVGNDLQLVLWEVKGPFAWEDSIIKLKVAARQYDWISFILVKRDKATGKWIEKLISSE